GHRLPGPRRSAPSRPAGEVRERREVAAAPQLGDSQFDRTRTGLPVPLAVAIALVAPPRTAFAVPGAAQRFTLQLHHALGGKADHLAQECGIGALLQKRTKGDLLIGHRGDPRVRVACPTQPYSGSPRWLLTGPPAPDSWRSLRRAGQRPPTPSPGTRPRAAVWSGSPFVRDARYGIRFWREKPVRKGAPHPFC